MKPAVHPAPQSYIPPYVWFATEAKVYSPFKLIMFDDKGLLELFPQEAIFQGSKGSIECRQVQEVRLVRQAFPWLSFFLTNALMLAMVFGGMLTYLTPRNPATYVMFGFLNVLLILVMGPTKWVEVVHQSAAGKPQRSYFADGSALGWGKLLGGTDRLYQQIKTAVMRS